MTLDTVWSSCCEEACFIVGDGSLRGDPFRTTHASRRWAARKSQMTLVASKAR